MRINVFLLLASQLAKLAVSSPLENDDNILLEDFENPRRHWEEMNDPVMGGKSKGTFTIEYNVGVFEGNVVNVPFLHVPGFIHVRSIDSQPFPDISHCGAFRIKLQSLTDYEGLRFSFGDAHAPHGKRFAFGYKTNLSVPTNEWTEVVIPMSDFTDYWDDATGDAIVTCQEDSKYCPTEEALRNLKKMAIWGEGVAGQVHVEIQSIYATQCASENNRYVEQEDGSSLAQMWISSVFRGWTNQVSLPAHLLDYFFRN
jgi:hypothetical protein